MKILLHSPTFSPNIGGVETVSHILAREWTRAGHATTVVTQTPAELERSDINYVVIRNPDRKRCEELIASHDIVHANSSSPRFLRLAKRLGKPFSWTHANYRLCAIDGLGWANGHPAPLSPIPSFLHHLKLSGAPAALKGAFRMYLLQTAAHTVDANVHITHHMARVQPLPNQHVIYNPYDRDLFERVRKPKFDLSESDTTFTFLGRLVSEKGPYTLLDALAIARQRSKAAQTLKFIGTGPEAERLKQHAEQLGVSQYVSWTVASNDQELQALIASAGICVIPSYFQEPMGVVSLELMTSGKPLIVSQTGGLSECAADAALTFPNGDAESLAHQMVALAEDSALQQTLVDKGFARLQLFDPDKSISAYISLFSSLIRQI